MNLFRMRDGRIAGSDTVAMESPVNLNRPFWVLDRDYLRDSDRDGVGDYDERIEGTDPDDSESTPGDSTIDVLGFYPESDFRESGGIPAGTIKHSFDVANLVLQDSGLPFRFRLVGVAVVRLTDIDTIDPMDLHREGDRHGADLSALFRPWVSDRSYSFPCGRAPLPGVGERGHILPTEWLDLYVTVGTTCLDSTIFIHELGHMLGLDHDRFDTPTGGMWWWSRGHSSRGGFHTIMAYTKNPRSEHSSYPLSVFSDPTARCRTPEHPLRPEGGPLLPCGVERSKADGADAVTSLKAVRVRAASVRDGLPDRDQDGFVDPVDLFPDDSEEWRDEDQDGIGNNADEDDDNDGVIDRHDAFRFDAAESRDYDGDGVGDNADTDDDGDGLADTFDLIPYGYSEFNEDVPLFPPAGDAIRQGFLRITRSHGFSDLGTILIAAEDSTGRRYGPISLYIESRQAIQLNSEDLENGNAEKGLPVGFGPGEGGWRLEVSSDFDVTVSSYVRNRDGFLTAMHDVAPVEGNRHRVAFFNPGSNRHQVSRLLIFNRSAEPAAVTITGVDDRGNSPGGAVRTTLPPRATRTFTAAQLESGGSGLEGSLGDGHGKWHLSVESDRALAVKSLLESPTGHLTNLSTIPRRSGSGYFLPFIPAADDPNLQGFVRVINYSSVPGEVLIVADNDAVEPRYYPPLRLALDAYETAHFNSNDLEWGNEAKGLVGVGAGQGNFAGDWRLELMSDLRFQALSYVRTRDGFLTSMHDLVPYQENPIPCNYKPLEPCGLYHRVEFLNPGRNRDQESLLRFVGVENYEVPHPFFGLPVEIDAVDDEGIGADGLVGLRLLAGQTKTMSAHQLETGSGFGLGNRLGTGTGKWRVRITPDDEHGGVFAVMSLLRSPTGHLTNLSTVPGVTSMPPPVPVERFLATKRLPLMVEIPPGRFDMGCLSDDDDCNYTELPVREVAIAQGFALSKYEVTESQWSVCVNTGGCPTGRGSSRFGPELPVSNVNWDDAQAYVLWLSRVTGDTYRLPSEAEWEYAARAGSVTRFSWGDAVGADRANCDGCGNQWTSDLAAVGSYPGNAWGLHDMSGNVSEVVDDCWNETYDGAPADGSAWKAGDCTRRVIRGGSFVEEPRAIRPAHRDWQSVGDGQRRGHHGFRVARSLER